MTWATIADASKYGPGYQAARRIGVPPTLGSKACVSSRMEKLNPQKKYIPLANNEGCACNECPHMRLNTIDKMINALETLKPEIVLDTTIMEKATPPLIKMLELSK